MVSQGGRDVAHRRRTVEYFCRTRRESFYSCVDDFRTQGEDLLLLRLAEDISPR